MFLTVYKLFSKILFNQIYKINFRIYYKIITNYDIISLLKGCLPPLQCCSCVLGFSQCFHKHSRTVNYMYVQLSPQSLSCLDHRYLIRACLFELVTSPVTSWRLYNWLAACWSAISSHCRAVVSRKSEKKAETEGAGPFKNTCYPTIKGPQRAALRDSAVETCSTEEKPHLTQTQLRWSN